MRRAGFKSCKYSISTKPILLTAAAWPRAWELTSTRSPNRNRPRPRIKFARWAIDHEKTQKRASECLPVLFSCADKVTFVRQIGDRHHGQADFFGSGRNCNRIKISGGRGG